MMIPNRWRGTISPGWTTGRRQCGAPPRRVDCSDEQVAQPVSKTSCAVRSRLDRNANTTGVSPKTAGRSQLGQTTAPDARDRIVPNFRGNYLMRPENAVQRPAPGGRGHRLNDTVHRSADLKPEGKTPCAVRNRSDRKARTTASAARDRHAPLCRGNNLMRREDRDRRPALGARGHPLDTAVLRWVDVKPDGNTPCAVRIRSHRKARTTASAAHDRRAPLCRGKNLMRPENGDRRPAPGAHGRRHNGTVLRRADANPEGKTPCAVRSDPPAGTITQRSRHQPNAQSKPPQAKANRHARRCGSAAAYSARTGA